MAWGLERMTGYYDDLESCDPHERETDLFSRLPNVLRNAMAAPVAGKAIR
jgi:phenylacetate-CoA ligase